MNTRTRGAVDHRPRVGAGGGVARAFRAGLQYCLGFLAALLFLTRAAAAETYTPATISDRDGYTNVRSGPANGAAVAGRVVNNEAFLTLKSDSDWWRVRTEKGLEGYMHISRIRMVATIEDPDGFTYVRRGKGTGQEITGKVWAGEAFIAAPSAEAWWVVWMPDGRRGYMHRSRITALPLRMEPAALEPPAPVEKATPPPAGEPPADDGLREAERARINRAVVSLIGAVGSEFIKRETLNKAADALNEGDLGASAGYGLQALATVWLRDECVESAIANGLPDLTVPQATELARVISLALDGKLTFDGLSREAQEEAIRAHLKTSPPGERATAEILFFLRALYENARGR